MPGGDEAKCSQVISTDPSDKTEIHLASGALSIGEGNTVTFIVANLMPFAGQKSS